MLKAFSSYIVYDLIDLSAGLRLAEALNFFIYDRIRIFLLPAITIFTASVIRSYFPPEKTVMNLAHKK